MPAVQGVSGCVRTGQLPVVFRPTAWLLRRLTATPPLSHLHHRCPLLSTAATVLPVLQAGRDVERLADQLMAVNENAFVHGSSGNALYGGRPNISDWTVTAGTAGSGTTGAALPPRVLDDGTGLDGSPEDGEAPDTGSMPLEIDVAPAGRLPFQEASLQVRWGWG